MAAHPRLAGLAAPLVAAAAFWLMLMVVEPSVGRVHLVGGGRFGGLLMLLFISIPVSFTTMLVFAVPAFLALRGVGCWSRLSAVLLGAVAGLVAAIIAFSWSALLEVSALGAFAMLAGALGGAFYAFIGMTPKDRTPAR